MKTNISFIYFFYIFSYFSFINSFNHDKSKSKAYKSVFSSDSNIKQFLNTNSDFLLNKNPKVIENFFKSGNNVRILKNLN